MVELVRAPLNNPLQKSPRIALPNTSLLASIFLDLSPSPSPSLPLPLPLLSSRLVVVVVVVFLFTRSSRYQLISRRVDDPNARVSTYPPRYIFDPGVAKSTRSKKNSILKSPVSVGGLTRHAPLCNSVGHIATGINHFPSSQAVSPLVIRAVVAR